MSTAAAILGRAAIFSFALLASAPVTSAAAAGWDASALAVRTDSLRVPPGETRVDLPRAPVVEVIEARADSVLLSPQDYTLVPESGVLVLRERRERERWLIVRYRYDPTALTGFVALHEAATRTAEGPDAEGTTASAPSLEGPDAGAAAAPSPLGALRIAGSKTVSVRGGTNRDATVDQGLNLSIHGQLTEGIGVRAEISDENLPITPEGNTEELRDLDEVRIELFGNRGRALLGDFRVDRPLGAFVPYERKLQGLNLVGVAPRGRVEILGGAPQGARREIEFRGSEGVQGPYELLDGRRLDQSFIVAGSERVWVDGEAMVRGQDNDYTIDYIRGTITFTPRRPIGPEHRVAVDFETSESGYRRNVLGVLADSLRIGPAQIGLALLREGDDAQRPRDRSLTEEEIAALAAAGDDPAAARSSGVRATAPGEGDYLERVGAEGTFYEFADSTGGDYDVDFLFVGPGKGSYRLDGVGSAGQPRFVFVGAGQGEYAVGRSLPLPERTDVAVARMALGRLEGDGASLRAEVDFSSHDANRLSAVDDEDNGGHAWRLEMRSPVLLRTRGGGLRLGARAETIAADFFALGRLRRPFFYETWNLEGQERTGDERWRVLRADWSDSSRSVGLGVESLERVGAYEGRRLRSEGRGRVVGPLHWSHLYSVVRSERPAAESGERVDRRVRLHWQRPGWTPFAESGGERFEDRRTVGGVGYRSRYTEVGLAAGDRGGLSFRREYADSLRISDSSWQFARDTRRWKARLRRGAESAHVDLDLTHRRTLLPGDLDETTRLARIQAALRAPARGLSLDLEYHAGTDQSRVLGRQVLFVGLGKGDYDAEGNPVGIRQGDYDVVFTPSDSLLRSTEVGLTLRADYSPSTAWAGGFSNRLLWQVEERNRSEEVGRLLRLDPSLLRSETWTVFGQQLVRDDLALLRRLRRWDARLSVESRRSLDQRFTQGPERVDRDRGSGQLEFEFRPGWSVRTDVAVESRRRGSTSEGNPLLRSYDVDDRQWGGTLRWRRTPQSRATLQVEWTDRQEHRAAIAQSILAVVPAVSERLGGVQWTLQGRVARVREEGGTDSTRPFFFERPGTGRQLSLLAQWGATGSVSVQFRYSLRDEPGRILRQDLGLETRARF